MPNKPDLISSEIRKIEQKLDSAYKGNHLLTLDFAQAAWYLLAALEYTALDRIISGPMTLHQQAANADQLVTHIKYPLGWLYKDCASGDTVPNSYNKIILTEAIELLKLGTNYAPVVTVFTYASRGMVDLKLESDQIVAQHHFLNNSRYEAYNRLIKPANSEEPISINPIVDIVQASLIIKHDRFEYSTTPSIIENVKAIVRPAYEAAFVLPRTWRFTRYSISEYFEFSVALGALTSLHWSARYLAALHGCKDLGYQDSIQIFDNAELLSLIAKHSGLPQNTVAEIIADLTYGNRGIKQPDPALQPLIPITKDKLAFSPFIWLNSAIERNFIVLMNKLSSEKKIYARLVADKENAMRAQMKAALVAKQYRLLAGKLPQSTGLPDIDLALTSDNERVCLILELKWFIYPAEIGEVVTRTEDLEKGVGQIHRFQESLRTTPKILFDKLGIDTSYTVCFAVVSENWIGFEDVQDPKVPIINQRHLMHKILTSQGLVPVIEWLNSRSYLPSEGVHYKIVDDIVQIGKWKLKWYGTKSLIP